MHCYDGRHQAGRQAGSAAAPAASGRSRLLARIMAQENHHLFSTRSVAEIRQGGCVIQRVGEGCETKGSPVPLRSGMAAASIVPWTDLYEEEERRMGASIYISRAAWENRDITTDPGFSC